MFQSPILYHKTQVHSDFLGEDIWNLLDKTYQMPDQFDFKIFDVKEEKYIGRPDLISLDAYGDCMFADIICKLNGISNPFELNVGMTLVIPSESAVVDFIQRPPINELETSNEYVAPSPKRKSSTRQVNDAVIGDKRFKIDSSRRIVIY